MVTPQVRVPHDARRVPGARAGRTRLERRRPRRAAEYYADPFEHDDGTGTLAALREWHRDDAATWAGTAYVILDCVADDDSVALRWRATSTHVGPWGPVPPTGRRVEWTGAHFFRVEAGRIVAMHAVADRFGKAMPARRAHDAAGPPRRGGMIGDPDGTRTRGLRRDRAAHARSGVVGSQ